MNSGIKKPNSYLSLFFVTAAILALIVSIRHSDASIDLSIQSSNGKIAFKSGSGIYTINSDGSGQTEITQNGNNTSPSWSSDGSRIVFSRQGPQDTVRFIYVMNADGSNLQKLSTGTTGDVDPTWSPDGSKIAFQSSVGSNAEIFVMNADGSNRINLTNNSALDLLPKWSPDGAKIAFVSTRDFPGISGDVARGFEIYVMNADGSNPIRLTNNTFSDSNPTWSPDSAKLAFDTNRDGNFEIYAMSANGSDQVDLSNNSSSDFGPCWSPDGQKIGFLSFRASVMNIPQEIFAMNADGSGQTRVSNSSLDENQLAWQPISNASPTPTPTPSPSPSPSPSPFLVISQVYGGGGTAGAAYQNSFVELFNRGTTTVDLNRWSLRFASATGSFGGAQLMFVSTRSIPIQPGQYMLIQLASEGSNGSPLQSADFAGPVSLGTSGKVALVKPNAAVTSGTCPLPNSEIADFVGFGSTANCFEGSGPAATSNNASAALRNAGGCMDNDNNGGDFSIGPPNPRNSSFPQHLCNLIDDARFFVRQHYLDFLNREPDQSGWDFWTNQITFCGSDALCYEARRIDVSASFFLSIEFQQSGYLVERFYKVGYGEATGTSNFPANHQHPVPVVRFSEFLQGTQRIGQGVIVLQPGWEQLLESNKQAYALEFVQTSRFTAPNAFPTTMTPAQFVDKLNQNAGNVLSASERTDAINLFGGSADSSNTTARAQAVRQVAEDTDLYSAEYNRAFVLAEYFGYLRRNPNDAPESTLDYTGYDFWLTKLNQFNGNYINAEMVKAFLSSIEYRQRFGP